VKAELGVSPTDGRLRVNDLRRRRVRRQRTTHHREDRLRDQGREHEQESVSVAHSR
jgi:hypothetical protein